MIIINCPDNLNIYTTIMICGYYPWNIFYDLFKCLRFLNVCLNAILHFPSHLQKSLAKFFLKPFVFGTKF